MKILRIRNPWPTQWQRKWINGMPEEDKKKCTPYFEIHMRWPFFWMNPVHYED